VDVKLMTFAQNNLNSPKCSQAIDPLNTSLVEHVIAQVVIKKGNFFLKPCMPQPKAQLRTV